MTTPLDVPRTARLDVRRLLGSWESSSSIQRRLLEAGYPAPGLKAVQKWQERSSVPSEWLIYLLLLAEREGRPIDLRSYVVEGTE